jgi:hypothetical protein
MRYAVGAPAWAVLGVLCVSAGVGAAPGANAEARRKATAAYDKVAEAYLNSRWAELKEAEKQAGRCAKHMTPRQRAELVYVRKTAPAFRPGWWTACKSTKQAKFRATIWGRSMVVDYAPADKPTILPWVDHQRRKVALKLSWNPSLVDNTTPKAGSLARKHHVTEGDLGEAMVWQQIGCSYMTECLPLMTVVELHNNHKHVYWHLLYFYGNLTSMYHCGPKARRTAMLMYASEMQQKASAEGFVRACRAISALFLTKVLADPSKWPSVNLPHSVPTGQVEEKTGIHAFQNVEPTWTIAEDRAWREALLAFFRVNRERALRGRGRLILPNKTLFMLMEPDDRKYQAKRDAWVTERLEKASK